MNPLFCVRYKYHCFRLGFVVLFEWKFIKKKKKKKNYTVAFYLFFSLKIMKSLQLCGLRQIEKSHNFLCRVIYILFVFASHKYMKICEYFQH